MKILYLCPDLGIPVLGHKGASIHVRQMVLALQRAGHQVTLIAQILNKSPWEKPAEMNVPVIQVRPSSATSSAVAAFRNFNQDLALENSFPGELRRILYNHDLAEDLRRRFENDPPDFIYERASLYAAAGVVLSKLFKVPLLLELNAPLALEQSAYRATGFGELVAQAERWALKNADAILVVSSELKNHVTQLGFAPEKTHIVPNAVDATLFRPSRPDPLVRKKLNLNGGPVLGFVGGLRPWHGIEALPQLLARLTPKYKNLQMVIVGDGQLRGSLVESFNRLNLQDRVRFTGALSHEKVPEIVHQFDVALAPYPKLEHDFYYSPLKIYEYMACGIPVAAANVGQIRQVIAHGKTGLLHAPGDLDELTQNCARLISNPNLRTKLGKAASKFVSRRFTWDGNAEYVMTVANQILNERSK
jgi:glycosyltransferase involved in cell wall biosynthesis